MASNYEHVSLFSGGMVGDVADNLQPANTYRDARNLKLLYNTAPADSSTTLEKQAVSGRSLALELIPGTVLVTLLPTNYRPIEGIETPLGLIVFSTNGIYSEIGRIRQEPWSYQTLYNDSRDPNGDKLDLFRAKYLQPTVLTENKIVCRVYWTDGVHGLRVLNLYNTLDSSGNPYHASQPLAYPRWLSAHQMDAQPALTAARMDFDGRIDGSLQSGAWQISYRLRTNDGHPSPWAPLTMPVWVMDQPLPASDTPPNHHLRYYGSTGIPTQEGLRFVITGLDMRWDTVEVAALYHSANLGVERARIVQISPVLSPNMTVNIKQFFGAAIALSEFKTQFQTLTKVGSIGSAHNLLYQANVVTQIPLTIDNTAFSYGFTNFDFCADQTGEVHFDPTTNPANPSRQDGDKLTNTSRVSTMINRVLFTSRFGNKVTVPSYIRDDYFNNKGQLVQQLFTGYRRGETYGFAAVCRDDRGVAYFAQPLGDITMPQLSDWPTSFYDTAARQWKLRHLGVTLSGIRIPYEVMYYEDGRLRLSSIEIVRTPASGRIGFQAVAIPATTNIPNGDVIAEDKQQKKIEPAVSWNNAYGLNYYSLGGGFGHLGTHRSATQTGDNQSDIHASDTLNKAYWATLHAPDVLIEGALPERNAANRLQLVGTAHKSTSANEILLHIPLATTSMPTDPCLMFYTKNYKIDAAILPGGDSYGRPKINSYSRIRTWFLHTNTEGDYQYEKIDPDNQKAIFSAAQTFFPWVNTDTYNKTTQKGYRPTRNGYENYVESLLQPGAIVVKMQDWESIDVIESKSSYVSVHLVNYIQPPTLSSVPDERVYQPTGYILPINSQTVEQLPTETINEKQYFVINGAEVFGGGTYTNLFDFGQLVPRWEINLNRRNRYTCDYGVGRIIPIESDWNIAIGAGRRLANNAFFPQGAAVDNEAPHATGGIAMSQPEDWNMASVLRPLETINLYNPKPHDLTTVADRPYSVYYTESKIYGEREDAFRKQLALNYYDLDGTKGPLIRLESLFGGVYAWQTDDHGRLRTFDRAQIPTSIGELTNGIGKALDGIDYHGKSLGLQSFNALTKDNGSIYWVSEKDQVLCRFSQAGVDQLTERERAHDVMHVLLPYGLTRVKSIALTTNPIDKELWVSWTTSNSNPTLPNVSGTLIYSEALDLITGWSDLVGYKYFRYGPILLASNPEMPHHIEQTGIGKPGQFFGKFFPASLTWVINPAPTITKKFDTMFLLVNEEGRAALTRLDMETSTDSQHLDLIEDADTGVTYRRGQLIMTLLQPLEPGAVVSRRRLQGKTMQLTLTIKPERLGNGQRMTLLASKVYFRPIPKT